jgi:hypothetical protein
MEAEPDSRVDDLLLDDLVRKGPVSGAFQVAGAGFEPATLRVMRRALLGKATPDSALFRQLRSPKIGSDQMRRAKVLAKVFA